MVYDHFDMNDFKIKNGKLETEFDRYLYMAMRINRCLCIEKLYESYPETDKSMVLIYSIAQPWDHNCQNPLPNQPERSKREDSKFTPNHKDKYYIPENGPIECNTCLRPPCNVCN